MSVGFAVLLFFAITIGLAVLPLLPGLREWRARTDTAPLRVVWESEVDVRFFARGFRVFVESNFAALLAECRERGGWREGDLEDGTGYVVVGDSGQPLLTEPEALERATRRLVLASGDLELPAKMMFLREIYAEGSVSGGEASVYRAILGEGDIRLSPASRSLRWLHAANAVYAGSGCVLHGRVSAGEFIRLDEDCGFERLNAPRVEFGDRRPTTQPGEPAHIEVPQVVLQPEDVPRLIENAAGRWLVDRELEIPEAVRVDSHVVVTGWGRVGRGVRIAGSIKSHKDLLIGEDVVVEGSVVSGRSLYLAPGSRVHGPVLAEQEIHIDTGVMVGSGERPTTVSARRIYVAPGALVHGTVWARVNGWVRSSVGDSWSGRAA